MVSEESLHYSLSTLHFASHPEETTLAKILVLHGLGMNMRGKVQTATFGAQTLDEYDEYIRQCASDLGVSVEIFHSNVEGEVVNKLYQAHDDGDVDAALFNPAAYSSGYPGILAAIAQVDFPVYEIHISNPASRGGQSQVAGVCRGVITGFGLFGYQLGMRGVLNSLNAD